MTPTESLDQDRALCDGCDGPADPEKDYCHGCKRVFCKECCATGAHLPYEALPDDD